MPYNFAADSFHTKKLCSRLSSSDVRSSMEIVIIQAYPSSSPWLGPVFPGAELSSLLVAICLDSSALVPKCLGSEVYSRI